MSRASDVMDDEIENTPQETELSTDPQVSEVHEGTVLPPPANESAAEEATAASPRIVEGTLVGSTLLSSAASQSRRPSQPRRIMLRQGLVGAWVVLTLWLALVLVADKAPGLLGPFTVFVPGLVPRATVTIFPAQSTLSTTLTLSAVTGSPDPARQQVGARLISVTSPTQMQTVQASGRGHKPAQQAHGAVTFYNAATYPQTIAAGTILTGADEVQIVTEAPAPLPAGNPPLFGIATVPVHAVETGPQGNIAALDINSLCCVSGVAVKNNTAFTGGQDARDYPMVRQQDIDGVPGPLVSALTEDAQMALQAQLGPHEQAIGSAQCTPKITPNHMAGSEAATITITVLVTCREEVYDQQAVQQIATAILTQRAIVTLGTKYTLQGDVAMTVTQIATTGTRWRTLALLVKAEGVWSYRFSEAHLHTLAQRIAGKRKQEASTILLNTEGVGIATIELVGGDGMMLPVNPTQIRIVVLAEGIAI